MTMHQATTVEAPQSNESGCHRCVEIARAYRNATEYYMSIAHETYSKRDDPFNLPDDLKAQLQDARDIWDESIVNLRQHLGWHRFTEKNSSRTRDNAT